MTRSGQSARQEVRARKGLELSRKASELQVAIVGRTFPRGTDKDLDVPQLAGDVIDLATEIKNSYDDERRIV